MSKSSVRVLVADDDEGHRILVSHLLTGEGFTVTSVSDGQKALENVRAGAVDILLLDFKMPGMDGMQVLKSVKGMDPDLPVIMITGYADIPGAVKAMQAGAHDYLAKPFNHDDVMRVLHRAVAERELKRRIKSLSFQVQDNSDLRRLMGPSDAIGRTITDIGIVAQSDFTVIIRGETGSGKELVAKAIHRASSRSEHPFVPVDCGAIPETLLESELFGYEKGAFTGAASQKCGKFEIARGGTLFLDEISNMPLSSQAKLLRALQEKKVFRLGGSKPIIVDARVLVATNQDLLESTASGAFRLDLFFRLNEFTIAVPPLRTRKEDVPYLAKIFLDTTNRELGKDVKGFSESAIEALLACDWPGNVRQLRSTIRRAVLLADATITERHLDIKSIRRSEVVDCMVACNTTWKAQPLKEVVRRGVSAIEREMLTQALKLSGGNKAKAARILNIDYKTMHTKVKEYGILTNGDADGKKEN